VIGDPGGSGPIFRELVIAAEFGGLKKQGSFWGDMRGQVIAPHLRAWWGLANEGLPRDGLSSLVRVRFHFYFIFKIR
jgi:hypothetical protein